MTSNAEQIDSWNGAVGDTWVAMQARLDNQLAPLGRATLEALAPVAGERVADIGCGAGQTTIEIAERVGARGLAIGVDISRPLLDVARARAPHLRFVEADAQFYDFGGERLDAIYSRFGVMFFADPVAAFVNLGRALRPGGRIAFVCWRRPEDNPILTVPLAAAVAAGVPMPPSPADPNAPGPFAFADRERVKAILEAAGYVAITHTAHDERVGGNDLDATLELALRVGPLARLLRELPEHRAVASAAARAAIEQYVVGDRVLMPSATWIVTASRT